MNQPLNRFLPLSLQRPLVACLLALACLASSVCLTPALAQDLEAILKRNPFGFVEPKPEPPPPPPPKPAPRVIPPFAPNYRLASVVQDTVTRELTIGFVNQQTQRAFNLKPGHTDLSEGLEVVSVDLENLNIQLSKGGKVEAMKLPVLSVSCGDKNYTPSKPVPVPTTWHPKKSSKSPSKYASKRSSGSSTRTVTTSSKPGTTRILFRSNCKTCVRK